jgi:endonuclease/exonuclease/phosphatase (EEP) superfamily protein YafD
LMPTWPAGDLLPPPVTIDHVLADERAGVRDYDVLDLRGSDHRPVLAEVSLGPAG